jgi:putative DNA primase/helicase
MKYHADHSPIPETWEEQQALAIIPVDGVDEEVLEGEVVDEEAVDDQATPTLRMVPSPTNPRAVAAQWMREFHMDGDTFLIRRHRAIFWEYDGTAWLEVEDARLEADLYAYLASSVYVHPKEGLKEWEPTDKKVRDVTKALGALVYLNGSINAPAWIDGDGPDVVPVANGLLDLEHRTLYPHTPNYFSTHVLPFDYEVDAPVPEHWFTFLKELWPDDPSSVDALQEVMGYVIAGGTSQQKIFALIGPKRGGKGTIGRVLSGLLGDHNVAAPTLASLATQFGMWPLIEKPLALVSDARISARVDSSIAVERLLTVSGEDAITVDRKYKEPVTGRLPTRFVILTNEIPKFADSSGALASRFILLVLTKSFYGQEDPMLTEKLLTEAAGILNWGLDGLDRLKARGYFEQPPSARVALQRLEDLSSPVSAFVRDRCEVDAGREVRKDDLWTAWKTWCTDEGRSTPGTKSVFARDLHAAFPSIREVRRRVPGSETRDRFLEGLGLRDPGNDPDDESEQQWTRPRPILAQTDLGQDVVPDKTEQNPRSDGMGQDGPGSSPLYPPQEQTPDEEPVATDPLAALYARIEAAVQAAQGNLFLAARELNEAGVPSGNGPWTAVKIERWLRSS